MIAQREGIYCRNTTDGEYTILNFNFETTPGFILGASVCTEANYDAGVPYWQDRAYSASGGVANISGYHFPAYSNVVIRVALRDAQNIDIVHEAVDFLLLNGSTLATIKNASPVDVAYPTPVTPLTAAPAQAVAVVTADAMEASVRALYAPYPALMPSFALDSLVTLLRNAGITEYISSFSRLSYILNQVGTAQALQFADAATDMTAYLMVQNAPQSEQQDTGLFSNIFGGTGDSLGDVTSAISKILPLLLILSVVKTVKN